MIPNLSLLNKTTVYIILFWLPLVGSAQQNLVPNGSFEEYWSCPTSNDLNDGQFEKCKYWWKPSMGTSDYFNRCNNGAVNVPNNFWGYQESYDGDGYVGMSLISWYINTNNYIGNEYIQTKLESPLKSCVEYYFEMRVNFSNYSRFAFSRIGALLTTNEIHLDTYGAFVVEPQILNTQGILADTINWVKVSGNFIASGNEEYLTIGYFFENVNNDTLNFQAPLGFDEEGYGYYLIDAVSLIEIGEIENCNYIIPNVFSPNDDGTNDVWKFTSPIEGELSILNRWGETIYYSIGTEFSWDGEKSTEGVYYYIFKTEQNNKTGFIQLIR